jgi:hypothetical protein
MKKQLPLTASWFDQLSDSALVGLDRIIKTPGNPNPLIDASRSTWWRWVAAKRAPQPVRLSPGKTLWRVSDLRAWLLDPISYGDLTRRRGNKKITAIRSLKEDI